MNGELNLMKKNRVLPVAFKQEAVRRMQSGERPSVLPRELDVRHKLWYEWRNTVEAVCPLQELLGQMG